MGGDSGNGEKWADSGENFGSGVPTGRLDGAVRLRGTAAAPSLLSAGLGLPHQQDHRTTMAVLELLRRAVFRQALSASRGPRGSLPGGWRSGPGPHSPCSDEQPA